MNSKRTPHPTDYDNPLFRWMYGTGLDEGRDEGREEGRAALLALAQQVLPAASYAQVADISDLTELRDQVLARVRAGSRVTAEPHSR